MPKWYERHCDECGEYYEGYGERYCSLECSQTARQKEHGKEPVPPLDDAVRRIAGEEVAYPEATLTGADMDRIESLDDLVRTFGADPDEWVIKEWWPRGGSWDMQLKGGEIGQGHTYKIAAHLIREPSKDLQERQDAFIAFIEEHAPDYPDYPDPPGADDGYLWEFAPFDLHLRKLAWGQETGDVDYDTAIAGSLLMDATEDAARKVSGFPVRQILVPLGNDLFNADNIEGTTTRGTAQDVDTRAGKAKDTAEVLLIRMLDRLAQVAPVKVLIVPGNHDRDWADWIGRVLRAWYRNTDRVDVDCTPTLRKYFRWGIALLGFTHGSEEKHRDLPLIMAREAGNDWAECEQFEYHIGHFHRSKQTVYSAGDSFNGVRVRVLPSLSGTDAWHAAQGYVKNWRAVESYLWSERTGYVGNFSSNVITRDGEQRIAA